VSESHGVAQFVGDNCLEVVLVGPHRMGVGAGVPIPAVDDGDVTAELGDAEHALAHTADGARVGQVNLDVWSRIDVATESHQNHAEGAQGAVQLVERVINPRPLFGGRTPLEAAHGNDVSAGIDLAQRGGASPAAAVGHQVQTRPDVTLIV